MPKLVDQTARRVAIAEAAWRVVLGHGVAGVSVRTVAAEAGLATASLRHAFPTQDALLTFCFELVLDRAAERITSTGVAGGARERAEQALAQVLPLDAERHAEMQVWLALAAASMAHPTLAPVYARGHDALRALCRTVVRALAPGADVELESARLHALLDGLSMHRIARGEPASGDVVLAIVAAHLDALVRATG